MHKKFRINAGIQRISRDIKCLLQDVDGLHRLLERSGQYLKFKNITCKEVSRDIKLSQQDLWNSYKKLASISLELLSEFDGCSSNNSEKKFNEVGLSNDGEKPFG